jgi:hypothetical protein
MTNLLTAEEYLNTVKGWEDPNPPPVVEVYNGFHVVRDDKLGYGSKARFIDYLISTDGDEWVFGGANKVGWGPISLTHVCNKYGKKATFFMAKRSEPTWHQQKVLDMGGTIHWVANGMLNVTKAKARKYYEEDTVSRRVLPLGLEHPTVLGSIIKVARSLKVKPTVIWTVASSGTLNRGLQLAFPDVPAYAVEIGHKMSDYEKGRAITMRSSYKYDQAVEESRLPPYPSEKYYDAKIWDFVSANGKEGALIWNVA